MTNDQLTFIETQFPVAKLSMESYKERKSGNGQTLTGLGKWWGRKPLVLVRAVLLGLLLPATNDPVADREVFLKLMTMDEEGLRQRKTRPIPGKRLVAELLTMPPSLQRRFLDTSGKNPVLSKLSREERSELQDIVFDRLPYGEKIRFCDRPEQIDGPSSEAWATINAHLGTSVRSIPELVEKLGIHYFGHGPRVGDAFCGGGSVPFEAARIGAWAYGADLNPVATLQTWAALNIIGGGPDVVAQAEKTQEDIYNRVDAQVSEWDVESNSLGWRSDIFLYCTEVIDPETGWRIPLAPTWVIAEGKRIVAKLVPDPNRKCYDIKIIHNASDEELRIAKSGTAQDSRLVPPDGGESTPIEVIRHNLRSWENADLVPRPNDVFQERLYCIRWVETYIDEQGREQTRRHYRAPTGEDLAREEKVLTLLRERFEDWQDKGYIPNRRIEPGAKTDEPIRTRGWTHWHHFFNPRQLLVLGLIQKYTAELKVVEDRAISMLGVTRATDWSSRLTRWEPSPGKEFVAQAFYNQALNPLYNYGCRGLSYLRSSYCLRLPAYTCADSAILTCDARDTEQTCDIWLTDPPYADAVNYHELTEYFLAWYGSTVSDMFPTWHTDSKRALAVKGDDETFRQSMVECYRRLVSNMPDNGLQIVMFTHQDAGVWADLTMILWAAGLRVTAAWTISTETESALKKGNYVQGTVLLVLRKRDETIASVFLDEILPRVEQGVRRQLDSMTQLDDASDPNFGDADYQLAAYAAALRVLTAQPIEEIDPAREIERERPTGEVGPVEQLIRRAVAIACEHLVPTGVDTFLWKQLSPTERFYLKGLEVESHGEYRNGVYQELARGFGANEYADLLAGTQANETRLKSASEFGRRGLSGDGFSGSLLRQCLYATHLARQDQGVQAGLNWLKTELPDYWSQRERIIALLDYLAGLGRVTTMPQWAEDGRAAGLLAGAVRNDHV